jgi:hypothetical protein
MGILIYILYLSQPYRSRSSLVVNERPTYRDPKQRKREGKKRKRTEEKRIKEKEESRVINDEFSLLERATSDSQSFDHSNGDQTKNNLVVGCFAGTNNDPIIPIFRKKSSQPQKCNAVY